VSLSDEQRLVGRAIRPDELQYFVFYTVPGSFGHRVVSTWSHSGLDYVKGSFLNDFWDERPTILFVACPGCN
jgi:hypothetical protein